MPCWELIGVKKKDEVNFMYEQYSNIESPFWDNLFRQRETRCRKRVQRENLEGFVDFLANLLPTKSAVSNGLSSRIDGLLSNPERCRPCGHAVRIAIKILPGKLNKKTNYDIRK
jgi:hypothetical protein